MAGPWEQYQQTATPSGPWTQYAAAPSIEPPMRGSASGGLIETGIGAITGLGASAVGGLAGLVGTLIPGERGQGARVAQYIQEAGTYQPRTQQGQTMTAALALPLELLAKGGGSVGEYIGGPAAGRTIGETAPAIAATLLPVPKMLAAAKTRGAAQAAQQAEANIATSYANAPKIEAAQTAQRLSLAVPPSISNLTVATRAISAIAGREADTKLSQGNSAQITKLVKQDLGDTSPDPISLSTIDKALDTASAPYAPVRAMPVLRVPEAATQTLSAIPKAPLIGGKAGAAAVSSLVDETLVALNQGRSGAMVLDDIRKLRSDAQAIFKANDKGTSAPDPVATESARAKMKIANALEDIVDANAPPDVLPALKAARVKMAQIYDHERALDYASGAVDPQMYAKLLQERKGQMTGLPADIGKVAAIYPSVMTVTPASSFTAPRLVRGGLGATAGAVLGSPLGPIGAAGGLVAGTAAGAFAGNLAARRMASPAFQAKYAMPTDYRPTNVNALAIAPEWQRSSSTPGTAPPTQAGNQFTLGEYQPPQPPTQMTMASIDYPGYPKQPVDIVRRYQEGAEAAQRATEAATRLPTGEGLALELGPGNKLRPAQQSGVGPVLRPERLGENVTSAVDKITSGRTFQMSAVEKVAWDKTKVDLAAIEPGFNTLSDKAINGKIMDRQWVADAITKARDKAAAFDEITKRATDAQKIRAAAVDRQKMLDLAELLGETLSARPVGKSSQGPKTRAAQRLNQLAPEEAVIVTPQNRLGAP